MLIEIHMLKNYAPTNLNRDDIGSPKTCIFGGVQRSRISSQCLKRSWRQSEVFTEEIGTENLGIRTRKLPELVAQKLRENGVSEEYIEATMKKVSGFGNKEGKENSKGDYTAQVAFYSPEDIEAVAAQIMSRIESCENIKEFTKLSAKELQSAITDAKVRPITLDIALFGRMITSDAFADVDASMQVAHAISTNRVTMESDFFTAMDDLISGESNEDLGAGMMGDVDYNSSCYYIYASLDTDKLAENLRNAEQKDEIIIKAIPALVRTMAFSNPSGKQNTFAGHALPSAVLVECKTKNIPVSYANAFVEPVKADRSGDLVCNSIQKLADEAKMMAKDYQIPVEKQFWFCSSKYDISLGENAETCSSFVDLVNALTATIR